MAIDEAAFRVNFPEFTDAVKFPSTQIVFWLGQAYVQLNPTRFVTNLDFAAQLFTAHNVVLSARAAAASASTGGVPGEATGPTSSKSVGPVSVSYDTGASTLPGAGAWNLTIYGQQFYKLLKMAGAGGIYVGAKPRSGWRGY